MMDASWPGGLAGGGEEAVVKLGQPEPVGRLSVLFVNT